MTDSKGRFRVGVDIGGTFTDRLLTIHGTARQALTAHVVPISAAIYAGKVAAFTSRHLEEGATERRLSAGMGTGAQTLVLAQSSSARIVAVNNHPPFIDALNREARRLPAVRVRPERAGGRSILLVGLVGDCLAIVHQSVEGLGLIEK